MQTILQFPARNKGRVRKSQGFMAMGECAMKMAELPAIPDNVERLVEARADAADYSTGDLGLFIATAVYAVLDERQKASLTGQLKSMATSDPRAVAVLRILCGKGN